jgi:Tol biopolymer transport system component
MPAETREYTPTPLRNNSLKLPGGTIAFSLFDPGRKIYEIHLINPDGSNHRLFSLDGVSEPALHRTEEGTHLLAYRAWSQPTSPRSLLSSNLEGEQPELIGGFWEDAQPDWSPTENRLIFASQRESDRRWRLYTIWGDGSAEVNLRREGKSPTFAPDGQRFAFESCDDTGNRCGLWVAALSDSEYGAKPLLQNPRAAAPDWSPVADKIAYMANRDDNWELYVIDLNNRQINRLTNDPAVDGLPAWSPDGRWLAFVSNRNENWGIWALNVESGQLNQVYSFEGGVYTPPVGEPYGERNWWDEQISWSE